MASNSDQLERNQKLDEKEEEEADDDCEKEAAIRAMIDRQVNSLRGVYNQPELKKWVFELNNMWLFDKIRDHRFIHFLHLQVFPACTEPAPFPVNSPYTVTMALMQRAYDFFQGKGAGMSASIFNAFVAWLRNNASRTRCPDLETQVLNG